MKLITWLRLDWSLSNSVLAERTGADVATIRRKRRELCRPPPIDHSAIDWAAVDWSLTDTAISNLLGCTRSTAARNRPK